MSYTMHIVDAADAPNWARCCIRTRYENKAKDKIGLVMHPEVPFNAPPKSKSDIVNVKTFDEAEEYMSKLGKKKVAKKKAEKKDD